MAAPVSQAFLDEQSRTTREPDKRVVMVLDNVAAKSSGGTILEGSSNDFSTDYPGAGAIDGDKTHLNYGPAADADNGKGKSGWKSKDASKSVVADTAAEFRDGAIFADYAGTAGKRIGLPDGSVWPQIDRNRYQYSQQFEQAAWNKINCTITVDATTAPDGTTTADRLVENAGAGGKQITQAGVVSLYEDIPYAIFVKPDQRSWVLVQMSQGGNGIRQWFDVGNCVLGSTVLIGTGWSVVAGSARIRKVKNYPDWRRIEIIFRPPSPTTGGIATAFLPVLNDLGIGYTGDGTSGLYIWGAQFANGGTCVPPYALTTTTPTYDGLYYDFDDFTPASNLAGQRGWTQITATGAGAITVETAAARGGSGNGVWARAPGPVAARYVAERLVTAVSGLMVFDIAVNMQEGGYSTDYFAYGLYAGASPLLEIFVDSDTSGAGNPHFLKVRVAGGAAVPVFDEKLLWPSRWYTLKIVIDRTSWPNTLAKVFYSEDGVEEFTEAWRDTVDTTGFDRVRVDVNNLNPATPPAPSWYFDDLAIHTGHPEETLQAQILDIGAIPTGLKGRVTQEADELVAARLIDGAWYPTINRDPTVLGLRDVAARTAVGQTFTPTEMKQIDGITMELGRNNNPPGNVWLEILATSSGVPTADVLARSTTFPAKLLGPNVARIRFTFLKPFVPDGTSQYAIRVMADFPVSATDYVTISQDATTPTYTGGQAFDWDGTTYTMQAGRDHPFVCWSRHLTLEQFDKGTEDTDLRLQDSTSLWWLAQAFEVPRALRMRHLQVLVRAINPNNVNPDGVEFWFDLHADDGTGTKPSNEVLAVGARVDPTVIDWTTYKWFALRLVTHYDLIPGVRYWWVLKGTEQFAPTQPASALAVFAADDSSPSYANGRRAYSDDSIPKVWTAVSGGAMPFRVLEEERPFWRIEAAYSGDDLWYMDPEVVSHNPARSGSQSDDFTGKALPYWVARAVCYVPAGPERVFMSRLKSLDFRAIHAEERYITVDFGEQKSIDVVRMWGHPISGGMDAIRLAQSDDDISYTDIPADAFDPETLESYSHDEEDDQGIAIAEPVEWEEDFESGYTVDVELAGQQGWYQTAAHSAGAGNQMFPKSSGIHGSIDVEIYRGTPLSPLEYGWPLPEEATGFPYVFEWWEDKAAANNGEVTSLRFADGADSGADAWEVKWYHNAGGADVKIVDQFGESGIVHSAGLGITKQKIEVDEDGTLRYYVRNLTPPEAYVLYYTGRVQRMTADRLIIRAYNAVITYQSYDWFRFAQVVDAARLEIGGECFAGRFLATRSMRYLRFSVLDSAEGFAELLEVEARQAADVSDRVVEMTEEQDADFLQLRMKQSTLSLVLQNADRQLSKRNPNGPYFGQLGGGAEIVAEMGFLGVPDRLKAGTFKIDDWNEDISPNLRISATNAVKGLETKISSRLKARQRYGDLIEYIANKTGLPSQMIVTDRASGFVDYYIGDNVDAWSEIQKIGEAAGGSRVWVDRLGRLRTRTTGDTAADTRLAALYATENFRRAFGPPAEMNGKLYVSFVRAHDYGSGLQEQLQVAEYDIEAGTWRDVAGGVPINILAVGQQHGYATQMIFDGELYVFLHYQPMGTTGLRIVRWDGAYTDTGSNWEEMYERADVAFGVYDEAGSSVRRAIHPSCTLRNWFNTWSADPTDALHHRFDMHNLRHRLVGGANEVEGCVVIANGKDFLGERLESDQIYINRHEGPGGGYDDTVRIARIVFETLTDFAPPVEAKLLSLANLSPPIWQGTDVFGMGLATDGDETIFTTFVGSDAYGTPTPIEGKVYYQNVWDWTVGSSPAAFGDVFSTVEDNARDGISIAYTGERIYAGTIRTLADKELALMRWDMAAGEIVNGGNLSLSNTRFIHLVVVDDDRLPALYGLADEGNIVELIPGRRLPRQTSPIFEVTDDVEGAFEDATLSGGDDDGESRIINVATVRSNPLVETAKETVWQASGLPWPVALGKVLGFRVSLREAALPYDAADADSQRVIVTFASTSAATIELESHHKSPFVKIEVSSGPVLGDTIVGCYIEGNALKRNSELVAVVVGNQASIERFGIRNREFANDYIYDQFAQAVVAASIVARHQFIRELVSGVRFRALWHLEPFDLGTIRETERLFIDSNFYLTKFSRQYHGNQTMTVTVEEAIV